MGLPGLLLAGLLLAAPMPEAPAQPAPETPAREPQITLSIPIQCSRPDFQRVLLKPTLLGFIITFTCPVREEAAK